MARRILGSSQPRLIFASHLANWEIPAVVAKTFGADTAVLYRRPNIAAVSDAVIKMRAGVMGQMIPTNLSAPVRLAHLLQAGVHVGMLVDQHFTKGVNVTFFGRTCKANPLIALLARQIECPIHGMRVVRLPDGNDFWGEMTEADRSAARRRRPHRHPGHHAGDYHCDRRLDTRSPGTMAVVASAMALKPNYFQIVAK